MANQGDQDNKMARKKNNKLLRILGRLRFASGFGQPRADQLECFKSAEIAGEDIRKILAYIEYLEGIQCASEELAQSDPKDPVKQLAAIFGVILSLKPESVRVLSSEFKLEVNLLRKAYYEAVHECESWQESFDVSWSAQHRAIEMWQKETGKTLTHPDTAHLIVWLLKKLDESGVDIGAAKTSETGA